DPLEGRIDRQGPRRRQDHVLVAASGANVRELFLLGHVDVEIVLTIVLADDHALVDLGTFPDEHLTAGLKSEESIGSRYTSAVSDHRTARSTQHWARVGFPAGEERIEKAKAARLGEEVRAEADQAAGGNAELDADAPGAHVRHVRHLAAALTEPHRHGTDVLFRHVDHDELHGLLPD